MSSPGVVLIFIFLAELKFENTLTANLQVFKVSCHGLDHGWRATEQNLEILAIHRLWSPISDHFFGYESNTTLPSIWWLIIL